MAAAAADHNPAGMYALIFPIWSIHAHDIACLHVADTLMVVPVFYGNDAAFVYLSQKPVPVPHRLYNKIRLIYIAVSFLRHVFRAAQRVQMMRFRDVELIAVIRCPSAGAYRYLSTCGKFG